VVLTDPTSGQANCFTGDYAFWSCFNDTPDANNRDAVVVQVSTNESIWRLLGANLLQQAIGSFDVVGDELM
jgi:hypothetical protein